MLHKIYKNKNYLSLAISLGIFLVIYLLSSINSFYIFNKKIQNKYYSLKNIILEVPIHKKIIILEIDDITLEENKKWNNSLWRFPFDRKAYIPIIERLTDAWVALIAFDVIFVDTTNPESDQAFESAIKKAGNVMIGSFLRPNGSFNASLFSEASVATGFFSPKIDPINSVVYSIVPSVTDKGGNYFYHFSLSVLKKYYSYTQDYTQQKPIYDSKYFYLTPDKKVPLSWRSQKNILINYSKYSQFQKENRRISFIDVYNEERFQKLLKTYDFKDTIVLIGASATGIKDVFNTPNGIDYWVYVHANMINTILNQNYLVYFDPRYEYILLFLLIVLSVYLNMSRSGYVLIFSNIATSSIFLLIFPLSVILTTNLILNYPIELIVGLLFSLTGANIAKYIVENKNKLKLNKALSEYVSSAVAKEILSGEWELNLDGEKKDIAIFFSDIEGFTTISENFSPEDLVWFLREYLSSMSDIILDEKGFINKYEWDAVMALWWVFGKVNTHDAMKHACISALEQQKALLVLNEDWTTRGFSHIRARIGIHFWEAITWNIGSTGRKMEFTALWDSVNLASRLEWVNKQYGTYICVSESVVIHMKELFEFRFLDTIKVKGKSIPVKIYELLAYKDELSSDMSNRVTQFDAAMEHYRVWDFEKAKEIFMKTSRLWDAPSTTYVVRCSFFITHNTPENWDGIWTMKEK